MKKIMFKLFELLPFFTVLAVLVYIGYWQMAQFKKIEHLELQILEYQKQLKPMIDNQELNEQQTSKKNRLAFGQNTNQMDEAISSPSSKAETIDIEETDLDKMPALFTEDEETTELDKNTIDTEVEETVTTQEQETPETMPVDYDTKEQEVKLLDTAKEESNEEQQQNALNKQLEQCQKHLDANRLTASSKKVKGNAYECYTSILEQNPQNEQAKKGISIIEKRYERYIKNNIAKNNLPKAERFISILTRINPENNAIADLKKQLDEVKFLQESLAITETTEAPAAAITETPIQKQEDISDTPSSIKPKSKGSFIEITAGCFNKKSSSGSQSVCIEKDYLISKYEVTQKQWKDIMGNNPSHFKSCGANCPVENVSWFEVQEFIRRLNKMTGKQYRLPTENEWEYAARAGTTTKFSFGNDSEKLAQYGNYCDKKCTNDWRDSNYDDDAITTAPVGKYKSNPWGLFDIHGNVWEWVQDKDSDNRVYRGGSWGDNYKLCQSSSRGSTKPDFHVSGIGFRLIQN